MNEKDFEEINRLMRLCASKTWYDFAQRFKEIRDELRKKIDREQINEMLNKIKPDEEL